jgi:hypothetical protein
MDVSVSTGVATFPRDGFTAESILLAADRACFVAKRTGRGLIATADEGLAVALEFSLQEPTPVDPPTPAEQPPATMPAEADGSSRAESVTAATD